MDCSEIEIAFEEENSIRLTQPSDRALWIPRKYILKKMSGVNNSSNIILDNKTETESRN